MDKADKKLEPFTGLIAPVDKESDNANNKNGEIMYRRCDNFDYEDSKLLSIKECREYLVGLNLTDSEVIEIRDYLVTTITIVLGASGEPQSI